MQQLMGGKKVLVIIPAYNEEGRIGQTVSKVKKRYPHLDILVVNDGSKDNTHKIAEVGGASVITLPINLGYGAALEAGYEYASRNDYDYIVQMDADGQHDHEYIESLLEPVLKSEADIVIGTRFHKNSEYKTSLFRLVGSKIFSKLASALTGEKITDVTSGFQAMNREVLAFFLGGFYPHDYPDADVVIALHRAGFRMKEVPVKMYTSPIKESMHSGVFKPLYYIFKMSLSIPMVFLRESPNLKNKKI